MGAVTISGMVSLGLAGDYLYFGAMRETLPVATVLLAAPVAGVAGGLSGGSSSRLVFRLVDREAPLLRPLRSRPVSAGAGFGNLLTPLFPSAPPGPVVPLGMAAGFVGVVRARVCRERLYHGLARGFRPPERERC